MHNNISDTLPTLPMPARSAGRKRSRGEASVNLEPDSRPTVAANSLQDWVHGEGMVLIKPVGGYVADASSQSGPWVRQKSDEDQRLNQESLQDHTELRCRKSQRLDRTSETAPFPNTTPHSASTLSDGSVSNTACGDALVIDNYTFHLGIGWRRISDDEHIQAAARGWARFIENNFGLAEVHICLESKGLQSYLIEASNGYFLFAENLRRGRFVSATAEGALHNLQLSPPNFEGPELDMLTKDNTYVNAITDSAMALDL